MGTQTLDDLAGRVERLERENTWLKRGGAVMVLGMALAVTFGTTLIRAAQQVAAQRFVVRDAQGRERATLGLDEEGLPALALLDERGRPQVALQSQRDHSSTLEFRDRGRLRLSMEVSSTGASTLHLLDSDQRIATGFYVWPNNEAGVVLNRGLGGLSLGVDPEGGARVKVADPKGRAVGGLTMDPSGKVSLDGGVRRAFSLARSTAETARDGSESSCDKVQESSILASPFFGGGLPKRAAFSP